MVEVETRAQENSRNPVRIVDLFCGAGGLACGFDFDRSQLNYETVLEIDNDPAAGAIFNSNFMPSDPNSLLGIRRLADMTWFVHPTEVRLFYLSHLALANPSDEINSKLKSLSFQTFLQRLRLCDSKYNLIF